MNKVINILHQKYKVNQLAHFYIIESFGTAQNECPSTILNIEQWTLKMLGLMKSNDAQKDLHNHPDFLFIGANKDINLQNPEQSTERYTLEDFSPLFTFISHKKLSLKNKFVVIYHAHLLSETIMNKLLKVLEEPINDTIIFLLNPNKVKLLPTIHSRAIHLRVNPLLELDIKSETADEVDLKGQVNKFQLHEFIDMYKNDEEKLTKLFIKEITKTNNPNLMHKVMSDLKWLEEAKTMHNPKSERIYTIYRYLEQL